MNGGRILLAFLSVFALGFLSTCAFIANTFRVSVSPMTQALNDCMNQRFPGATIQAREAMTTRDVALVYGDGQRVSAYYACQPNDASCTDQAADGVQYVSGGSSRFQATSQREGEALTPTDRDYLSALRQCRVEALGR